MAKQREKIQYLWQDRKRICGMPITFTRYRLSEDRLFLETGLFNSHYEELLLYRVRDITVRRTLWQKIFAVGSVLVQSSDQSAPQLELRNIKDPIGVKELLHDQVERNKLTRRMRISEVMGTRAGSDDDDDSDDDLDPLDNLT